jgi:hypothetical protein
MRRRGFVKALAAIPAAPMVFAQKPAPVPSPDELPALTPTVPDAAAEMVPRFFTAEQFSALRKLSDLLMPAMNGSVGALDAKAPEFLDFLIGDSPEVRKQVYLSGLDALNTQSRKQFNRVFAELDAAQAGSLLSPLRQPWTFDEPADAIANFLRIAKQDVRTATVNSREYNAMTPSGSGRRFGGGMYWYPLD